MASNSTQKWSELILRGLSRKCPKCGQGKLFAGYLKQVEACENCGERFGHIRADDGPAWLTILVVGHVSGSIILGVLPKVSWPEWVSLLVVSSIAVFLMYILLPRFKGAFIAMIWRAGCVGSEKS